MTLLLNVDGRRLQLLPCRSLAGPRLSLDLVRCGLGIGDLLEPLLDRSCAARHPGREASYERHECTYEPGETGRSLELLMLSSRDGIEELERAMRGHVLAEAKLEEVLRERLAGLDPHDVADLQKRGAEIRRAMLAAPLPADLAEEVGLA